MATTTAKRRSRKARGTAASAPGVVHAQRQLATARTQRPASNATAGVVAGVAAGRGARTLGERPSGLFGGLPVSELAILVGIVGLVIGWLDHNGTALIAGAAACGLGVLEVTAREHFSGFRSHATLLAAVPALVAITLVAVLAGVPRDRVLVLLPGVPVFLLCVVLLRRSFEGARHQRVISQR
jgi:hypothetical protein